MSLYVGALRAAAEALRARARSATHSSMSMSVCSVKSGSWPSTRPSAARSSAACARAHLGRLALGRGRARRSTGSCGRGWRGRAPRRAWRLAPHVGLARCARRVRCRTARAGRSPARRDPSGQRGGLDALARRVLAGEVRPCASDVGRRRDLGIAAPGARAPPRAGSRSSPCGGRRRADAAAAAASAGPTCAITAPTGSVSPSAATISSDARRGRTRRSSSPCRSRSRRAPRRG